MIIPVRQKNGEYDIILERGAALRAGEHLSLNAGSRVLIVTDSGVPYSYARDVAAALSARGALPDIITIPEGEASKSLDSYRDLLSRIAAIGYTRSDSVLAVGGGVVGDLAGFAAATYMRGIAFYNIPTTLLSCLDSSVGGKVAVDMDGIKNIVGAFYPPRRVLIDPNLLQTLDRRQLAAGLCEGIKMAATSNAALFEAIEREDVLASPALILRVIEGGLAVKCAVVESDPEERGVRRVLNFGHTAGHAIESMAGGALLHGECVGLGMLAMSGERARVRIHAVLLKYGLPTEPPKDIFGTEGLDGERLRELLSRDKKAAGDMITTVWVDDIGSFEFKPMSSRECAKRTTSAFAKQQ